MCVCRDPQAAAVREVNPLERPLRDRAAECGKVFIVGVDTSSGLAKDSGIGFVPQDDIVHQELTVLRRSLSARARG